jgi:hypothetical protein
LVNLGILDIKQIKFCISPQLSMIPPMKNE